MIVTLLSNNCHWLHWNIFQNDHDHHQEIRDDSAGVCPGRGGDTLVGGGGGLGRLSCTARGRPTGPGPGNIGGYKATGQTLPLGYLQLLHWTLCHSYLHITTLSHRSRVNIRILWGLRSRSHGRYKGSEDLVPLVDIRCLRIQFLWLI